MIKITIKNSDEKELIDLIQMCSFYIAFFSVLLFIGTNLIAFITWTYPNLALRLAIALFILGTVCSHIYSVCKKAINDYYSNKFKKV